MALDAVSAASAFGYSPAALVSGAGQPGGFGVQGALAAQGGLGAAGMGLDGAQPLVGAGLDGAVPVGLPSYGATGPVGGGGGPEEAFEGALNAVQQAEDKEQKSNALTAAYARGEDVPLHQVMEASEEASLALETLAALRNRMLDAVNELTRMQV